MRTESAFLSAITANPSDRASRLVYADWLEERSDPRGELIRIEEEMREIPVFSDRYWQLKPRRTELRMQLAPDWLKAMRYGTEYQPVFRHEWPAGWKERWRVIREFTDRWYRLSLGDVGGHKDEVSETATRLGRTFTPAVQEYVAFALDVSLRTRPRFVIRDIYRMEELNGWPAVSLLSIAEGCVEWAIRHQDFALEDPPIHTFHWSGNGDETSFVPAADNPESDTLTSFMLHYAMSYAQGEGGFGAEVADPGGLVRTLTDAFPVYCSLGATEVFEAENILVQLHHWRDREYLNVNIFKPLPKDTIPEFLWQLSTNCGSCFGSFFLPERLKREMAEAEGRLFPPTGTGADIPF
jgi:uncharacterized protein (TIGR02996 family)